jgi:hypothetical protein
VYVQPFYVAAVYYGRAAVGQESAEGLFGYHVLQLRVDACALGSVNDCPSAFRQVLYLKHACGAPA